MERRSFFKRLLGAVCAPFLPKVAQGLKSVPIAITPAPLVVLPTSSAVRLFATQRLSPGQFVYIDERGRASVECGSDPRLIGIVVQNVEEGEEAEVLTSEMTTFSGTRGAVHLFTEGVCLF